MASSIMSWHPILKRMSSDIFNGIRSNCLQYYIWIRLCNKIHYVVYNLSIRMINIKNSKSCKEIHSRKSDSLLEKTSNFSILQALLFLNFISFFLLSYLIYMKTNKYSFKKLPYREIPYIYKQHYSFRR